jgi:predicted amino acid dehydrogenase
MGGKTHPGLGLELEHALLALCGAQKNVGSAVGRRMGS